VPTARPTPTGDADALWDRYAATGDAEELLLHYRGLVDRVTRRMGADLPPFVDRADLRSYGILGLIDAIGKYDRGRPVKFDTYAATRIRGAVLDGLRSIDWMPRSVRAKLRDVSRAESALQMTLHRSPTEAELAAAVGISVAGLRKLGAEAALATVIPLDDARHAARLERTASRAASDGRADHPGDALEAAERRQAVACAIRALDDRDRTVIDLYYYRRLKLTEIGRVLGVTEARVSQLHARARSALRESLRAMDL
jgi:RNA polymerase sigma factor for flagellar operon FliA